MLIKAKELMNLMALSLMNRTKKNQKILKLRPSFFLRRRPLRWFDNLNLWSLLLASSNLTSWTHLRGTTHGVFGRRSHIKDPYDLCKSVSDMKCILFSQDQRIKKLAEQYYDPSTVVGVARVCLRV